MRIWDIPAGYLNRQSLLGEHRELHGIHSILVQGKKGYSRHPETLRWKGAPSGLVARHGLLAAEMRLRNFQDRSPLKAPESDPVWPAVFVTEPLDQFGLLQRKYVGKEGGRIPFPRDTQELWAQHKYSVLARSPEAYASLGHSAARAVGLDTAQDFLRDLVLLLRLPPPSGGLLNAVEHMWGHVRRYAVAEDRRCLGQGPLEILRRTQTLALREGESYLLASTALSELEAFLSPECSAPREPAPAG